MKKFTFIIAALLVSSAMFAQTFQANTKLFTKVQNHSSEKAYVTTLQWCADDNTSGIGINAADVLQGAAQFDASDLSSYVGNYITEIHVGIADASVITAGRVIIWTGLETTPVIVYEQAATFVNGWNEILLTVPYEIGSTALYIGYEITVTGGFPMGFDAGPQLAKGNWINSATVGGGWGHLNELNAALTYNNSIRAVVDDEAGGAVIGASPNELQFLGFVGEGNPDDLTVVVQGVSLTENISVVSIAPFEVSSDGTNFGLTATLPSAGGNLYVRYVVAAAGQNIGQITLSSTGAEDAIVDVMGVTIDCTGTVAAPYTEDFTTTENSACWKTFDANDDGSTWGLYYSDDTHTDLIYGYQYNSTNVANDWLVSPAITIPNYPIASFQYAVQDAEYAEKFEVYVITGSPDNYAAGVNVLATQTVTNETFATQNFDLSAYVGQEVYIGIKVVSLADMYILWVDNFMIDEGTGINNNVASAVSVYPNPASDLVTVKNAENANIVIMNMVGEVVATVENASSIESINISNLANGTYFVRVNGDVFKFNVVK